MYYVLFNLIIRDNAITFFFTLATYVYDVTESCNMRGFSTGKGTLKNIISFNKICVDG